MAEHHQHAYHPPSAPNREHDPERQRRRGTAAGAGAEKGMQKAADDWKRKVGVLSIKTSNIPVKGKP